MGTRHRFAIAIARIFSILLLLTATSAPQEHDVSTKLQELANLYVRRGDKDAEAKRNRVRELFPLSDASISKLLSELIQHRRLGGVMGGITTVVWAHQAEGLLWGLQQLAQNDTPAVRANLVVVFGRSEYRESLVFLAALLDDKRQLPLWAPVMPLQERDITSMLEPDGIRGSEGCGPERICDRAASYVMGFAFSQLPRRHLESPERFKGLRMSFGPHCPTKERDDSIAALKAWWKEEGERLAMEKRPSFIDDLLKKPKAEAEKKPANEDEKPK